MQITTRPDGSLVIRRNIRNGVAESEEVIPAGAKVDPSSLFEEKPLTEEERKAKEQRKLEKAKEKEERRKEKAQHKLEKAQRKLEKAKEKLASDSSSADTTTTVNVVSNNSTPFINGITVISGTIYNESSPEPSQNLREASQEQKKAAAEYQRESAQRQRDAAERQREAAQRQREAAQRQREAAQRQREAAQRQNPVTSNISGSRTECYALRIGGVGYTSMQDYVDKTGDRTIGGLFPGGYTGEF
jgi:hypothetical protein